MDRFARRFCHRFAERHSVEGEHLRAEEGQHLPVNRLLQLLVDVQMAQARELLEERHALHLRIVNEVEAAKVRKIQAAREAGQRVVREIQLAKVDAARQVYRTERCDATVGNRQRPNPLK